MTDKLSPNMRGILAVVGKPIYNTPSHRADELILLGGGLVVGGFGVPGRVCSNSDSGSSSGLGFRVGTLDTV